MTILYVTKEGYKVVQDDGTLTNSGTAAANVTGDITVSELNEIKAVISLIAGDGNNSGLVLNSTSGNKVNVTAKSVPAGTSTKVIVTVMGY